MPTDRIAREWEDYRNASFPLGTHPALLDEAEAAYYAGAYMCGVLGCGTKKTKMAILHEADQFLVNRERILTHRLRNN